MESRKDKNTLVLVLDADGTIYNKNFNHLLLYLSLQYQKIYETEKNNPDNLYLKIYEAADRLRSLAIYDESKSQISFQIPPYKDLIEEMVGLSGSKEFVETLTADKKALIANSISNSFLNYLLSSSFASNIYRMILFLANKPFFEEIKKQVERRKIDQIIVQHGSNRLSYELEKHYSQKNVTGFFTIDLQHICDFLNVFIKRDICKYNHFMPSDIFNKLEIGETYRRIIHDKKTSEDAEKKSLGSIFDNKKFLSLYAILNYYAMQYDNPVVFFWENEKNIRNFIIKKFENSDLLYKKIKLVIYPYDGSFTRNEIKEISGKGEIDLHYPRSIKAIIQHIDADRKTSGSVSSESFDKERFLILLAKRNDYYLEKQGFFKPTRKTRTKSKSSPAILEKPPQGAPARLK